MKKNLKIAGIVILVILIVLFVTPYIFKSKIETVVKQQINNNVNAKVDFADFSLSLFRGFPNLNIELKKLSVVGIDTFKNDTLLAFNSFSINVNLLSALGSEIKIKSIILDEPEINVIVLKNGLANYSIAKPSTDTTKKPTTGGETKFKLALNQFAINHANIIYDDASMNVYTKITDLNYNLKGDFTQDFTSLENLLQIAELTVVYGKVKYLSKVKIAADAKIDADLKNFKFTFKDNLFAVNELQLGFDGTVDMPKSDIAVDVKFDLKKADFKDILSLIPAIYAADFKGLKASGKLAFNGFAKGIYNNKNLPAFGANLLVENAMFSYPSLPKSVDNINVKIQVEGKGGTGDENIVDVSKFHVELAKNPFDIKMHIATVKGDASINGNFVGKIDFNSIKDLIPLQNTIIKGLVDANVVIAGNLSTLQKGKYDEFKAVGKIEMTDFYFKSPDVPKDVNIPKTILNFTPKYLDLAKFDMTMGKSDIQLTGKLENYVAFALKDSTIHGNLDLSSNYLDVTELMPQSEKPKTTTKDTTPLSVIAVPKNIDFILSASLKKIKYDNLIIDNTLGKIIIKNSKVLMENLKMNLLKGSMVLNGYYETHDIKKPTVNFGMDITNFDITETGNTFNSIQKLAPIVQSCKGNVSAKLTLLSQLDQHLSPVMNTVNSKGRLMSKEIAISNSPSLQKVGDALKTDKFKNLKLNDLDIGFTITNGNIIVDPFKTKVDNAVAEISGQLNVDQSMKFKINMTAPRSEFGGAANQVIDGLFAKVAAKGLKIDAPKDISFDINITGKVTEPKVGLGMKGASDSGAGGDIKSTISSGVKQKGSAEADKILADADTKSAQIMAEADKQAQNIRDAAKKAGTNLVNDAGTQGQKLIKDAGNNPFKAEAAKLAADNLKSEAQKKSDQLNNEADNKAKALVSKAKQESDAVKQLARKQADEKLK